MKSFLTTLLFLFAGLLLVSSDLSAQKFPALDKSPLDVSYYRVDKAPVAKVVYSRPQKIGREVFGNLVAYDKVWRTGANECTEIKFFKDATLGGQDVPAGTYSLFTIPGKENWTIILNKTTDQWGAYGYDQAEDLCRFEVPVKATDEVVEAFSIVFVENEGGGASMVLAWDMTKVEAPLQIK
jgi:hypothetical protein